MTMLTVTAGVTSADSAISSVRPSPASASTPNADPRGAFPLLSSSASVLAQPGTTMTIPSTATPGAEPEAEYSDRLLASIQAQAAYPRPLPADSVSKPEATARLKTTTSTKQTDDSSGVLPGNLPLPVVPEISLLESQRPLTSTGSVAQQPVTGRAKTGGVAGDVTPEQPALTFAVSPRVTTHSADTASQPFVQAAGTVSKPVTSPNDSESLTQGLVQVSPLGLPQEPKNLTAMTPQFNLNIGHDNPQQSLTQALGEHLHWQADQQIQTAELRLHPAELGAIAVTVHIESGKTLIHLSADQPQTQQLLQQTATDLKEKLVVSQGNSVQVDVSAQGEQQRRQAQREHQEKRSISEARKFQFSSPVSGSADRSILMTL